MQPLCGKSSYPRQERWGVWTGCYPGPVYAGLSCANEALTRSGPAAISSAGLDLPKRSEVIGLRSCRYRQRPRRLCLCRQGCPTRPQGGSRREDADLRRHLPEHRLHPVEGAAAHIRDVRTGRPPVRELRHQGCCAGTRPQDDDGTQGRRRRTEHLGRHLPVQEEQDRHLPGHRQHRRRRQAAGGRGRRHRTCGRGASNRHCHRFRGGAAARRRDRRGARGQFDRRAVSQPGAGAADRGRRRGDRARARLGVAAARGGGDGGRVPRPRAPRSRRRDRQAGAAHPCPPGHGFPPVEQGHLGRQERQAAEGRGRTGNGR